MIQHLVSHPSYPLVSIRNYFGHPYTAHDCAAILYVLANISDECFDMEIDFGNCGVRENQIKKLIDILGSKKGKLHTTILNLCGSSLSLSGLQALENAVRNDLLTEVGWLYLAKSLTKDPDVNAKWLTTFVEAVLTHCCDLRVVDLSDNNLGIHGALAISGMLRIEEPNDPKHVCLNNTSLDDEGLTVLIQNLKVVSSLELSENNICATGVKSLADAVCEGKVVIKFGISLADNMVGLEGTVAVGRMLSSSHCQLVQVILSRCELTTTRDSVLNIDILNLDNTTTVKAIRDVGQQLCQMPQSSTITILNLDGNSFTGVRIYILAGFMHLCPCLQSLFTGNCGITSDDLIRLFNELSQFEPSLLSELCSWKLYSNQIDDDGVCALMDHLFILPCLWILQHDKFWLSDNPINGGTMIKLDEELRRRKEVSCSFSIL